VEHAKLGRNYGGLGWLLYSGLRVNDRKVACTGIERLD
jgi:hypothetical protein